MQVVPLVHLGQDTVPAVNLVGVESKEEPVLTVLTSHHRPGHATHNHVVRFSIKFTLPCFQLQSNFDSSLRYKENFISKMSKYLFNL